MKKKTEEQLNGIAEMFRAALIEEIGFMREDGATPTDVQEYLMSLQEPSLRRIQ